ncbi:MAG: protease complex subunit PrcB family protein [Lachnospiraceae bacterium]|nr:protease complex subunit PrcB family protein [Lachnospiraceae bacterium]
MKKSLKSYVLCLTASLAAAGMLVGCGNQASILPEIVTIDTLEEEKPANDSTDSAEKNSADNGQTETSGEVLKENSSTEGESAGGTKGLNKTGTVGDYEYTLEGSMDSGFFLDRGYFLMASDETDEVILAICSGKRSTGGYSIEITDIDYKDPVMTITVKENSPAPDTVVTEAFTCPICYIRLSSLPKEVKVVTASGAELNFQGNYREDFEAGNDYIAVLSDGAGEIIEKTYVYKNDDGTYRYVNVEAITESWGSTKWNETLVGSGTAATKEEIVEIAKNHNSCGSVFYPFEINDTDDYDYTIISYEELQSHYISVEDFLNGDF